MDKIAPPQYLLSGKIDRSFMVIEGNKKRGIKKTPKLRRRKNNNHNPALQATSKLLPDTG
ncbi:MAG: hypothetical protein L3J84_07280 [Gammaproteobacteria bacterium]|nr:hypothetical protein [Gammaproteobacteria bacterium]